jgi:hypothetical protein
MGKFAFLFLIAGLAIGLWLGFTPASYRAIVRWWQETSSSRQESAASPSNTLRRWDRGINRFLRSVPVRRAEPPKDNSVPTGPQISAELQAFWQALRDIWLRLLLKLGIR